MFDLFSNNTEFCNCGLKDTCRTYKMNFDGKGLKKVLIVGEAPGKEEDEQGRPFVGKSGQLLDKVFEDLGIEFRQDCWITNVIKCRPPENRTPVVQEIKMCREYLFKEIEELKPNLIIGLGKTAFEGLIGLDLRGRLEGMGFEDFVGQVFYFEKFNSFIAFNYHPAYILRNEKDIALYNFWIKNFEKFFNFDLDEWKLVNKGITERQENIKILFSEEEILEHLDLLLQNKEFAFDIETTGLKPFEDEEILSISFCSEKICFAFSNFTMDIVSRLKEIFINKNIYKICHNAGFELFWIKRKFGIDIQGLVWDTALSEHIIDNQEKVNLKFLALKYLGKFNYDEDIDVILKDMKKNRHFLNQKDFLKKFLFYNALDSLYAFEIFKRQKEIGVDIGMCLFLEGIKTLVRITDTGINIDIAKLDRLKGILKKRVNEIEENLKNMAKEQGIENLNINSTKQLADFFIKKGFILNKTEKGNFIVDEEFLETNKEDKFIRDLLAYRKMNKIYTTYLKQIENEIDYYRMKVNPVYSLLLVSSYRSSCQNPNFQNIPKRNEFANIVRSIFIPEKDSFFVEYDYASMEARIYGCYGEDENWIKYIENGADVHTELAGQIFLKPVGQVDKQERFLAKNNFTFATLYGSYWRNTGKSIWFEIQKKSDTLEYLKKKGIYTEEDFIENVKKVEDNFWNMFPKLYQYRERVCKFYEKNGYIETKTGFRYVGYMTRNQILNFPIQGSAFHCLLWSLIKVENCLRKMNLRSKIVGQIHDAMIFNVYPEEEQEIDKIVETMATKKIREHWNWIIVPLAIEKKKAKINESWDKLG